MTTPISSSPRVRIRTAALAALGVAGGLLAIAGPAESQSASCSGITVTMGNEVPGGQTHMLVAQDKPEWGWVTSRTYSAAIPAGTYDLNARSYDGYDGRSETEVQPNERWKAEFLDADGAVLATSGITADLADGVPEASWAGSLGQVVLAADAVQVRVRHAFPSSGGSAQSVRPVCVGAVLVPPPTTTTVPTPTTEVPPTTAGPTEVLPEVAVPTAPPAKPQTSQPSFTG